MKTKIKLKNFKSKFKKMILNEGEVIFKVTEKEENQIHCFARVLHFLFCL